MEKITYHSVSGKIIQLFLVLFWAALALSIGAAILQDSGQRNLHIYQAQAFLQGDTNISKELVDIAVFQGKYYVPFPPFPAIILLPFVALFGSISTTFIAAILTLLNVYVFLQILKKLDVERTELSWLTCAFFLGTGYWHMLYRSKDVWQYAHIVAVTFMLLAIYEALETRRGIIAGLLVGCAFLSRQLSIYNSIFILSALWQNNSGSPLAARMRSTAGFLSSLGLCVIVYLGFNFVRFGNPFDTGYSYIKLDGFLQSRIDQYGLFNPAFFLFNFVYMFFQGPHLEFEGLIPTGMDPFGTSLTFASPFLFFAFFDRWKKPLLYSAWTSIGLILFNFLLYHNNGYYQVNTQRFTLDFLPILILLVSLSVKHIDKRVFHACILYSIFLNFCTPVLLPRAHYILDLLGYI